MNLTTVYSLGNYLQYIRRCPALGVSVKGENLLIENLIRFLECLEELKISKITQIEIKKILEKFDKTYKEKETLTKEDTTTISDNFKLWNDRIKNELNDITTIEVFTEGALNYKKLLEGAKSFFLEEVWNFLSQIAKSDLNDACNCLLTRSWTPAVMISLRASEDCIRQLYEKQMRKKSGIKGWKDILDELEGIKGMDKTLIGYLNYIRDMRNTAEHPDRIFEQMEAEQVFHQVVNMTGVVYKYINNLEKNSVKEESKEIILQKDSESQTTEPKE